MKPHFLAVLVILAHALPAQGEQPPPKKAVEGSVEGSEEVGAITSGDSEVEILPDGARIIRTIGDNGEIVEKHIPPQDPSVMGMPQMALDEMARHGGGFFEASVMVRPPRLAPGESGELYVYVTLRGFAVVVPGARVEAEYKKVQGPLVLGSDDLMPAKPGTRKTRFKGKPVYDDSLTFKIPITVSPDAKHGPAQFEGSVLLEITHGDTGDVLGRFRAVAPGRVEFVDWITGYGNCIILNHGEGYYTLYAHASDIFVAPGQVVARKEVIAEVGDTGSLNGYECHFEIRKAKKALNPSKWFAK